MCFVAYLRTVNWLSCWEHKILWDVEGRMEVINKSEKDSGKEELVWRLKVGMSNLKKKKKHSNIKWTTLETPMRITSHTGLSKPIKNLDFHLVPSYPFPELQTNEQTRVLEKWITPVSS